MHPVRILSASAQVAAHLRREIERGRWSDNLPGIGTLAADLAVNHKTVEAALCQLEREGQLTAQGARRSRRIVPSGGKSPRPMRIAILPHGPADRFLPCMIELQHALTDTGHTTVWTEKSLTELGMVPARIARLVEKSDADAWIILAGSSEVLEWFSGRPTPAFALFGRRDGIPIAAAGPDSATSITAATRYIIARGHRRIVSICRSERRRPFPGITESAFLQELAAHNIPTSDYNLPDWTETGDGLRDLLTSLFRVTPPTALILGEGTFFSATQQFLAQRRLRTPEEVSLFCLDPDPSFTWCKPTIAHIHWDPTPIIRRTVQWAASISKGRSDKKQTVTASKFVPGGTIGPAPAGS